MSGKEIWNVVRTTLHYAFKVIKFCLIASAWVISFALVLEVLSIDMPALTERFPKMYSFLENIFIPALESAFGHFI